jgi:hypothetical protein
MTTHAMFELSAGKDAERSHAVAEVELTENALIVHVRGMDRLWALKSRLEIPLAHVAGAVTDPEVAQGWPKGIRSPGTHVPGVITAGTFYQEDGRVFWDMHDPDKTVVIHLSPSTTSSPAPSPSASSLSYALAEGPKGGLAASLGR